jgi:sugar phosphate isomerase/epimerase
MALPLALHTWTLDTTPLAEVLRIARATGWDGVELRRVDFARAAKAGQSAEQVLDLVRASGPPVACVGVQLGWMFASGDERSRLLEVFAESCRWAVALDCRTLMSPVDFAAGALETAAASVREVGDLAAQHGLRLALEHQSQAPQLNSLAKVREVLARADHPAVGLLLDTYHLQRSGDRPETLADLAATEIAYVQFSDVPTTTVPGETQDRLPPGEGVVPFRDYFAAIEACGYTGFASFEAPNPATWQRDPSAVAAEALALSRARLFLPPDASASDGRNLR